jgi:flavin reductase
VTIDAADFRRAVGRYATGVTVITTRLDGADHAMTANSFTSVSLDPLLVLFCAERESRFHEAVVESGQWGVSVLAQSGRRHAQWFATRGRPLIGQFANAPHRRGDTGVLLLDDAIAWLECTTVDVHRAGDHDIVVGSVTVLHELADLRDPLVYWTSQYCTTS